MKLFQRNGKKFPTTKIFFALIFLNCTMVEIYSMWVMFQLSDLSSLDALIGAVIAEGMAFAVYCCKSFLETREEERVKLEYSKLDANTSTDEETINEVEDDEERM